MTFPRSPRSNPVARNFNCRSIACRYPLASETFSSSDSRRSSLRDLSRADSQCLCAPDQVRGHRQRHVPLLHASLPELRLPHKHVYHGFRCKATPEGCGGGLWDRHPFDVCPGSAGVPGTSRFGRVVGRGYAISAPPGFSSPRRRRGISGPAPARRSARRPPPSSSPSSPAPSRGGSG